MQNDFLTLIVLSGKQIYSDAIGQSNTILLSNKQESDFTPDCTAYFSSSVYIFDKARKEANRVADEAAGILDKNATTLPHRYL